MWTPDIKYHTDEKSIILYELEKNSNHVMRTNCTRQCVTRTNSKRNHVTQTEFSRSEENKRLATGWHHHATENAVLLAQNRRVPTIIQSAQATHQHTAYP